MRSPSTAEKSPRSEPPGPTTDTELALGIDLGATKVVSALVARDGTVVRSGGRQVHANDGPEGVLRSLVQSVRSTLDQEPSFRIRTVGIAVAAQVDPATGTVVHAPNLNWHNVPLGARLSRELDGAPVVVVNDARAATLAEWRLGAGRGVSDLFCLILGTGVGGSAVVGNRLLEGGTHAIGEVGHITIVSGGRKCHCPNAGCLEAYVGGWAVADRAREAIGADPKAGESLLAAVGYPDQVTARTVVEAYRRGDPLAHRLIRETTQYLCDGVVSIVNAFNPDLVVLGGGFAAGMPEFARTAEGAVRLRCQPPAARARVTVGRFGENAPLVGAAEAARLGSFPGSDSGTPSG